MTIKVIAADDHFMILKMIGLQVDEQDDMELVATQLHNRDLDKFVRNNSPDVLILDLNFGNGIQGPAQEVKKMLRLFPKLGIIILTGEDSEILMLEMAKAGALGYLLKSDELSVDLPEAIRIVYEGEAIRSKKVTDVLVKIGLSESEKSRILKSLSDDQLAILRLICQGFSNPQIAKVLDLQTKTVANRVTIVYGVVGVRGEESYRRIECINIARALGICE